MFGIRDNRTSIKLSETIKIGKNYYSEINIFHHDPRTLLQIIKNLPPFEEEARQFVWMALLNKKYKKNNNVIYFGPPLEIDGEIITHVGYQASLEYKKMLLAEVRLQSPFDHEAISMLEKAINKKEAKKRGNESYFFIPSSYLPLHPFSP